MNEQWHTRKWVRKGAGRWHAATAVFHTSIRLVCNYWCGWHPSELEFRADAPRYEDVCQNCWRLIEKEE